MDLTLTGTVVQLLEEKSGSGRNGPWRKREFILEVPGEYPKKVCIMQWGDAIDRAALAQGDEITAHIDIASREYNGRWYTDVKAWKVEKSAAAVPQAGAPDSSALPLPAEPADVDYSDDDLPF